MTYVIIILKDRNYTMKDELCRINLFLFYSFRDKFDCMLYYSCKQDAVENSKRNERRNGVKNVM